MVQANTIADALAAQSKRGSHVSQAREYEALVRLVSDVIAAGFYDHPDDQARAVIAALAKAAQEWPTDKMLEALGWEDDDLAVAVNIDDLRLMFTASPLVKGQDE